MKPRNNKNPCACGQPKNKQSKCCWACHVNDILALREQRFWNKVDRSSGPDACWIWNGSRMKGGYGSVCIDSHMVSAGRVAYAFKHGSIPRELDVLHHCDNPPCVNPSHLFLGTDRDNAADRIAKGRQTRGERHHTSTISDREVAEIRRWWLLRLGNQHTIARRFGIHPATVSKIVNGKSRA